MRFLGRERERVEVWVLVFAGFWQRMGFDLGLIARLRSVAVLFGTMMVWLPGHASGQEVDPGCSEESLRYEISEKLSGFVQREKS